MIKGYDLSHYQGDIYSRYRDGDFYILKATEGIRYKDKKMCEMADYFRGTCDKLIGFYHYAHPEKNTARAEAAHFLKTVEGYLPAVLALDWEGKALYQPIEWAREWLDRVYGETGIRPLFYAQSSYIPTIGDKIVSGNYGLWVARYGGLTPQTGAWKTFAMWQHTSKPVDKDLFNGNLAALKKYGGYL